MARKTFTLSSPSSSCSGLKKQNLPSANRDKKISEGYAPTVLVSVQTRRVGHPRQPTKCLCRQSVLGAECRILDSNRGQASAIAGEATASS